MVRPYSYHSGVFHSGVAVLLAFLLCAGVWAQPPVGTYPADLTATGALAEVLTGATTLWNWSRDKATSDPQAVLMDRIDEVSWSSSATKNLVLGLIMRRGNQTLTAFWNSIEKSALNANAKTKLKKAVLASAGREALYEAERMEAQAAQIRAWYAGLRRNDVQTSLSLIQP